MTTTQLADLVAPVAASDVLAQELASATTLGLPTTAFQAVQVVPTLLNVQSNLSASYTGTAGRFAQAGYASSAAAMVDSGGQPIAQWLDVRANDQFNISRNPATYAASSMAYVYGGPSFSYSPTNPIRFQNPTTQATYTSTGTGTLASSGNVSFQADREGASSTVGAGVTLNLLSSIPGLTLQALTTSAIGTDAESNPALLSRGQNKLGSIDMALAGLAVPLTPKTTYQTIALQIPQGVGSPFPPYSVTAQVTRVGVSSNKATGTDTISIANVAGGSSTADCSTMQIIFSTLCVGDSVTCIVQPATNVAFSATFSVYIQLSSAAVATNPALAALVSEQVETNINNALFAFFEAVPIGGFNAQYANSVPISLVNEVIFSSNQGTIDLVYQSGTDTDLILGPSGVPLLGSTNINVIFV